MENVNGRCEVVSIETDFERIKYSDFRFSWEMQENSILARGKTIVNPIPFKILWYFVTDEFFVWEGVRAFHFSSLFSKFF